MPPVIEANKVVRIAYTLRNQGGDVLDSSEGGPPLAYIHGRQQIVEWALGAAAIAMLPCFAAFAALRRRPG